MKHTHFLGHTADAKLFRKNHALFNIAILVFALAAMFFVLRGTSPYVSELSYIEYSSINGKIGSVVPASCDAVPPYEDTRGQCGSNICIVSPANPKVGDTVTWSLSQYDIDTYTLSGNYVFASYFGTSPTYTSNTNYGGWAQYQTSTTKVYSSPGTQYANLFLYTTYWATADYVTESCSVTVDPVASCSNSATNPPACDAFNSCTSSPNACGQTNTGSIVNGACNVGAPANPAGYGSACTSSANRCGMTNTGTIQCDGSCSVSEPSNSACNGRSCTAANACGNTDGTYGGDGVCSPPANPSGYGNTCTSAANACGQTNSGTITCSGSCSASAPSSSTCAPSTPTLSALYQGDSYLGGTAAAYYASGYTLYANATSPSGANLAYYFEWSPAEAEQWSGWVGSGGWGSVAHYADYGVGTYYARAWAYDSNGNYSASPSAWAPFSLTTSAPTVSCSGAPGNPYIGQAVIWSSSVSGGSGSYSYSWGGTDDLSGSGATVTKTYATLGQKSATLSVTDTRSGQTGSATCTSGGNSYITVSACTASLSANPNTVEQGVNTSLSWSVSGGALCASSCTGSGFNTGGAISGTAPASVLPTPPTTSYALTCVAGAYGPPPPVNTTVTVIVPSITTFTVNGQSGGSARINSGANNASVAWSSGGNATSCAVTKNGTPWNSGVSSSGITDTITSQTVYAIDCQNDHGVHATASIIVNVLLNFQEF